MNVLVSWIGHTDLRAMALAQTADMQKKLEALLGSVKPPEGGTGPVKTLLDHEDFDRVYLLSNYAEDVSQAYVDWLGRNCALRHMSLTNPTDYGEILSTVSREMQTITRELTESDYRLSILLSPGTPAMAAIWVLLGKTQYPATFYQTYAGNAWRTDIPFDLTLDVIPKLLRGPDSSLQHLAAHAPSDVPGFESIIGNSQAIRLAVGRARKAAVRDVPVLLLGESGTGKEMFAHAMHAASHRREKPFEVVNCAALPSSLLESELFGYEKGAFTGADSTHRGAFERADGGTLFLDEIGECSLELQSKLLRILQPLPGEDPCATKLRRLGGEKDQRVNVRVIAATNRDLVTATRDGAFRDDLLYRLAVITIKLPPLRHRRSDIPRIADALLAQINADFSRHEPGYVHKKLSDSTTAFMVRHPWPGNVRELRNCLLQAAVMSANDELTEVDLRTALSEMPVARDTTRDILECPLGDGFSLQEHLEEIQRHFLGRAMREAHGVKAEAARLLGMKNYQTLDGQLKRLDVDWESHEK
ncbi:MAG: sigma 54-interacting transcriptional regulator [Candidatus Pacebacteria bacterium]|nr:sigma 54-interacting transcriptional regulator [Candidatus Paceibacterota bacterium]